MRTIAALTAATADGRRTVETRGTLISAARCNATEAGGSGQVHRAPEVAIPFRDPVTRFADSGEGRHVVPDSEYRPAAGAPATESRPPCLAVLTSSRAVIAVRTVVGLTALWVEEPAIAAATGKRSVHHWVRPVGLCFLAASRSIRVWSSDRYEKRERGRDHGAGKTGSGTRRRHLPEAIASGVGLISWHVSRRQRVGVRPGNGCRKAILLDVVRPCRYFRLRAFGDMFWPTAPCRSRSNDIPCSTRSCVAECGIYGQIARRPGDAARRSFAGRSR